MSLCAHVVALWLAACALAARPERERPQCNHSNCQWKRTENDSIAGQYDVYDVSGRDLTVYSTEGKLFETKCSETLSLDQTSWPRFLRQVSFENVVITDCAPPTERSYGQVLASFNVTPTNSLSLLSLPKNSRISNASFVDFPSSVKALWMSADTDVVISQPGALAALDSLRNLFLDHVQVDQIPMHLEQLTLQDTGLEILSTGAANAETVKIREPKLRVIRKLVPGLRHLRLDRAPALTTLVIHYVAPGLLHDGLLKNSPNLEVLELKHVEEDSLPPELLLNVTALTKFTCTNGNLKTLPDKLFSNSTELVLVDLNFNKLRKLPSDLFSGLTKLRVLRLTNNLLRVQDLRALAPLTALTELNLTGNHLKGLCPPEISSIFSNLRKLEELSLRNTGTTRICASWLHDLRALRHLDLTSNKIHYVSCSDFATILETNTTVIDLSGNPLKKLECQWEDRNVTDGDKDVSLAKIETVDQSGHRMQLLLPRHPLHFKVSDSKVPDSKVPDSKVTDSKVPDTKVTDSKVPESKSDDSKVPD